jgi:hypothetical protein
MYIMMTVIVAGIIAACTPCVVREAQTVVAEADSLRAEGQMYDDSVQLAEACATLGRWQWFYADDYAHACYHYGRLLREKGDPVTAMQVLIRATHSRTHDYHILGRVYSNMGSISHLANDYSLSYDMYQRSADMFLSNGDSLNYYYALNDMAYELAHLRQKDASLDILEYIVQGCSSTAVLTKLLETKAETYLYAQQYDSAIFFAAELYSRGNHEPDRILIRAQAFSFLGIADSAVYYAQWVLAISNSLSHRNNALYILTNDDELKDKDAIRQVAADRADTQKLIEIRQGKLSQAVQLLEQDLQRKPNLTWLYAIILTAILVGGGFYWRNRIRKRQMQQQVNQIVHRQADAITQSIKQHIDTSDINHTLHWKNYEAMKADADLYIGNIVSKLECKKLNETEIRFCVLTMLDLSLSRIADTICYSFPSGIKTLKKRISLKLGTTPRNLRDFLFQMAINA